MPSPQPPPMDAVVTTAEAFRDRVRAAVAWVRVRWLACVALVLALPLAAASLPGSTRWIGRPFPGFFVMENRVVPTVGLYSWTGIAAGMPFHGRIAAVDDVPITTAAALYRSVRNRPIGTPIRYTVEDRGTTRTVIVPTMTFGARDYWLSLGALVVTGLLSMGAGIVVGMLRPGSRVTTAFLSLGIWSGYFAASAPSLYHPAEAWLGRVHFLAEAFFPASFLHFALVFPLEPPLVRRRPWVLALPYAVSAALAAWIYLAFFGEPPDTAPLHVAYGYSSAALVAIVVTSAVGYWRTESPDVRYQLRLVVPWLLAGTAIAVYGFANTAVGGDFPINLIAFTPFLFYVAIAWGIAYRDLFDVDRLVRQGLAYGLSTLAVMGAYAGGAALVAALAPWRGQQTPLLVHALLLVGAALLIEPFRARVQALVDRVFARGRLDYRRTVDEVSRALTRILDLDTILAQVGRPVADGLQLSSFRVLLWSGPSDRMWRYDAASQAMVEEPAPDTGPFRTALADGAPIVWLVHPDGGSDSAAALTERLGGRLLVPLTVGGTAVGTLVLGGRRSGRPFARDDLDVVATLAAQAAIAIENARSYQALEDKVRERTHALAASNRELRETNDELRAAQAQLVQSEKMASLGVLVAGVAHEINNPVSFIVGNVAPMMETLEKLRGILGDGPPAALPVVDRVSRMFGVIAQGAERTAAIVDDLRTFSRLGDATTDEVDLHDGLEVTLRLLHPRWFGRIEIHREYGDVPRIRASPGQLNQVFMNLLANACDAIPGNGNVWIATRADGDAVRVEVCDDGTGIAVRDVSRIFDPFFTTKAQGKGTGLGLSISHGIVAAHGGRIEVAARPGGGTCFAVVLPLGGARSVAAGGR